AETDAPAEISDPTPSSAPDTTDAPDDTAPDDTAPDDTAPDDTGPATTEAEASGVLRVPDDHATITDAVDAAAPGDLILIAPGTYHESVNVTTDDLTIRGLDRSAVVLDGEFELDNGIRVLGASGVVVENLTAQNYTTNGVFFLEV